MEKSRAIPSHSIRSGDSAALWRLFVAVPLPSEARHALLDQLQNLSNRIGTLPVSEAHLHVTLCFYGDVNPSRGSELQACLRPVCESVPPLHLRAEGLGTFGD